MSCRLSLFGLATLQDGRGRPVSVPAKTFALAAFLILSGGRKPAKRSAIRQFLWPSADPKTAAANLRKFLARVRERQERFGFELIRCERGHVELVESARIDLDRFLRVIASGEPTELLTVCDLYCGDLLEGLGGEDVELGEWMEVQRTKLRDAFTSAVALLLESGDASLSPMSKRLAARRLTEVDSYNEAGHRALMRLYAEEGELAHVKDVYDGLERRLRQDLGVEPNAATLTLFHSLLPKQARSSVAPLPPPALVETSPGRHVFDLERTTPGASRFVGNPGAPRITLLPPVGNGSQGLRQQVAGSLIEDITIGLCRSKSLTVVAPHTAWQLSASGKRDLLKTLGIDYSVESQLQYSGEECRLSVKLVSSDTRDILWTAQYPFHREHADQSYRDLSAQIIVSLVDKVERSELAHYDKAQDPTAYHLYLVGQKYARALDLPNVRRARRAFKASLSVHPDFVPSLSGLARTFQTEWLLLARGETNLLEDAKRLAALAIEIDPDDARGFRELGVCNAYLGRFDEGLEALARGEQCHPQYADLLSDAADAYVHACEPEKALEKITRAIELNPLCPDTYWWAAGGANFQLDNYAKAIECLSRMREQAPAYRLLAASCAMLGDREQAERYAAMTRESHPDFEISAFLSAVPFRDAKIVKKYEHGLREAGFR